MKDEYIIRIFGFGLLHREHWKAEVMLLVMSLSAFLIIAEAVRSWLFG